MILPAKAGTKHIILFADAADAEEPGDYKTLVDKCQKAGITVVKTPYQHNELSDRGPDHVKTTIRSIIDKFLDDDTPAGTVDPEKLQKDKSGPIAFAVPP